MMKCFSRTNGNLFTISGLLLIGGMTARLVLTAVAAPTGQAQPTTPDSETPDQQVSSPAAEKPSVGADDEGLRARLLAEAPKAWSKIIRIADHLDMTIEVRNRQGDVEGISSFHVKLSGNDCLIMAAYAEPDGSPGRDDVFCRNSRYSFQLTRSNPDAPWVVKNAEKTPHQDIEHYLKLWSIDHFSKPQLFLGHVYLPKIFGAKSFVIKSVDSVKRGSDTLVSFAFEYTPPEADKASRYVSGGVVSLNPNLAWGIEDYRIDLTIPGGITQHLSTHNDVAAPADGVPLFLTSRRQEMQNEGQPTATITSKVQNVSTRDIPKKEFTLTAFDLPEDASASPFR